MQNPLDFLASHASKRFLTALDNHFNVAEDSTEVYRSNKYLNATVLHYCGRLWTTLGNSWLTRMAQQRYHLMLQNSCHVLSSKGKLARRRYVFDIVERGNS